MKTEISQIENDYQNPYCFPNQTERDSVSINKQGSDDTFSIDLLEVFLHGSGMEPIVHT